MIKKVFFLLILGFTFANAQPQVSDISSAAGSFSRFGFGPRGIAMGNALSAVTDGNLVAYYNPALASFQGETHFQTSHMFLSFDRSMNFIAFTKRFDLNRGGKTATAGISAGIINAGVSNIDGRDAQGIKTGELSTSENQFFVAVSSRISEKFAIGFNIKIYYYSLYENFSATSAGLDIGAIYKFNSNLTFAFTVQDINSKYKWDSSKMYGLDGKLTVANFPMLFKLGASYSIPNYNLLVAGEFEISNFGSKYFRIGAEYELVENFFVRAGLDGLNLANFDEPIRPSAGFEYSHRIGNLMLGVNYAFAYEPFSTGDRHIVGIILNF